MTNSDLMLSTGVVARMFGVSTKTVTRWAQKGSLPSVRTPGGHRRFYRSDVDAFLAVEVASTCSVGEATETAAPPTEEATQ